ncbi:MAG: tripartite tricarboxylate transporter substrate-binding protein [Gemmatimonadota bacterium]|nr:tripartite tricarboxylate transporter substrate-binding protein [Gemmatimonadota bacterium]
MTHAYARRVGVTAALLSVAMPLAACGGDGGSGTSGSGEPSDTEMVTHNEAGGGSDLFTRAIIEIMKDEDIISGNWPVVNVPEGDSIGAMAYLVERQGSSDAIAQITPTWLVTPMTVDGEVPTVEDLTPIAEIVTEPMVVAVRADSPYENLQDFIDAAQSDPNLVQVGGSTTATDSLTGTVLKQETGVDWKFLSFEDSGSRITAVLRGDADVMFGSPGDFTEQVRAGDMRVITVFGPDRIPLYEDAVTTDELGITPEVLPEQFRAIVGAPDMPQEAVDFYRQVFSELVESDGWEAYAEENGAVTEYRDGEELETFLEEQRELYTTLIAELGL